ncbi:MAG TPA: glycosyltransferase family 4 protein [Streptosporangiaceae bacterium]|nr:glycosyltransferase family 4 protein [Streptosporangiaceae bacterium]
MRVLIFHGYLLRGTGSNIYNASLARSMVRLGHEVHLFCQDRHAAEADFVDAVGRWTDGRLRVEVLRTPVRCTAYLPDIGGLLPVYVADRYEGFDARPYPQLTDAEIEGYIAANVAAVRDVVAAHAPQVALANHLVMGPVILARALGGLVPYAVKIHGSALEYTVRPNLARFGSYAREGLTAAGGVLAGSRHTAKSLWEVVDLPGLPARTRLLPPGVDVERFRPRPPAEAAERLRVLADQMDLVTATWGGDSGAARALRAIDPTRERIVGYLGKLIVSKGVDLLVAAWPLVAARVPDGRLLLIGFGTYREALTELVRALGAGDLAAARAIAARGRELEGGSPGELRYLAAFFDGLHGAERERYVAAAATAMGRVHFTGRIEHDDVPDLLSATEALVVPSTFPEAFGMVVAEAACCGALPLSARHSGLAEVTAELAPVLDEDLRGLLSFERGPGAVREIADKLTRWLTFDERGQVTKSLAEFARGQFGWERIAAGVIDAALGRLYLLPSVGDETGPRR